MVYTFSSEGDFDESELPEDFPLTPSHITPFEE